MAIETIFQDRKPCYFIAEVGCNHNGSLPQALRMIQVAKDAGADAAKFQVFHADELYATDDPEYIKLKGEELSFDDFRTIQETCKQVGIDFLATPFDLPSVDFLETLDVAAYKIGSGELDYLAFLRHVAATGKSILLSTGMGDDPLIDRAVQEVRRAGCTQLALLHCVSAYPAPLTAANVRALDTLAQRYDVPVGFSDHSLEPAASYAAVARGARIIEKHFTLSRQSPGDDHPMSLEPAELAATIAIIRDIEAAMGDGKIIIGPSEAPTLRLARRSLYAGSDIAAGELFTTDNIRVRRPQHAVTADQLDTVLGRRSSRNIAADTPITQECIDA